MFRKHFGLQPLNRPFSPVLLCLGLLIASPEAMATVKIIAVSGASNVILPNANTSPTGTPPPTASQNTKIYGGTAGVFSGLGTNVGTVPFDTCAWATPAAPLMACNNQAIDARVYLTITYSSDKAGFPVLLDSGTTNTVVTPISAPTTAIAANAQATVTYTWSSICAKMASVTGVAGINNDCQVTTGSSATHTFNLGIASVSGATTADVDSTYGVIEVSVNDEIGQNNPAGGDGVQSTSGLCETADTGGACAFGISNGDGKVVLRSLKAGTNFPTGGPLDALAIRVLWAEGENTFASITANSSHEDLAIDKTQGTEPSVSPSRISGFTNDRYYSFKIAVVDMAKNVGYYTSTGAADTYCLHSTGASDLRCHIGHPGEVVGVLSKDVTCFVATAAYGSQMAPQVETFRQFRDLFLKPTAWGAKFVKFYYEHSPKYARMIAQSETLRALARWTLAPLLIFAWLAVNFGVPAAAIISLLALASLATLSYAVLFHFREKRRLAQEAKCHITT